jgi:hypothetical protein
MRDRWTEQAGACGMAGLCGDGDSGELLELRNWKHFVPRICVLICCVIYEHGNCAFSALLHWFREARGSIIGFGGRDLS